jgi:hypothetical protein
MAELTITILNKISSYLEHGKFVGLFLTLATRRHLALNVLALAHWVGEQLPVR